MEQPNRRFWDLRQIIESRRDALGSWMPLFDAWMATENFANMNAAYVADVDAHYEIYPAPGNIFRAFELTPADRVKCIVVGQDPYHTPGQAPGLAFSVPNSARPQPSLQNIKAEIETDIGPGLDLSGNDLSRWAMQGVFLLNTALTVRRGQPASHRDVGWWDFTQAAIQYALEHTRYPVAVICWGLHAKNAWANASVKYESAGKYPVPVECIASAHPSPFSANKGFFGSKPFGKANAFLAKYGWPGIDWSIPNA